MYDENFNKLMNFIFNTEGGYSNDPCDKGGATNLGITHGIYDEWNRRHKLPLKDIKSITKKEAMDIYYEWFWKESGADKLTDLREAYFLFDMSINSGPQKAKKVFKESNGNIYEFLRNREKYYEKLIKDDPTQKKYEEGWRKRLKDLENNANEIVNSGLYTPPYQNEVTIFDKEYEYSDVLDPYKINKKNEEEVNEKDIERQKQKVQNARNKYLYEKYKKQQSVGGKSTGGAAPIQDEVKTSVNMDNPISNKATQEKMGENEKEFRNLDEHGMFRHTNVEIDGKKPNEKQWKDITEGYKKESNKYSSKKRNKHNNEEDGYWYTTKSGKHVFVPDEDKVG